MGSTDDAISTNSYRRSFVLVRTLLDQFIDEVE